MKRKLLLLFFILTFGDNSFAQIPLLKQWDKRFGAALIENLTSLNTTKDNGFILGGYSNSLSGGDKSQNTWGGQDYWIVKLDSAGNKEWDKDFGGIGTEVHNALQQTFDGGYILGGLSNSGISGDKTQGNWDTICTFGCTYDYWILKTDSIGNKEWDKRFGGTNFEELYSLQQTSDGGYILGGISMSGIGGDKSQANWDTTEYTTDYWVVKTDSLGNKEWDADFGGTNFDILTSVIQSVDGGYLIGGFSRSGISGNKTQANWDTTENTADFWIVKLDTFGNKQWDKVIGGTSFDMLYSIKQTFDNGFILGGLSASPISGDKTQDTIGSSDYWIVKIDLMGNKQWEKVLGGSYLEDWVGNISITSDNGYLMAGTSYSQASGDKSENNMGPEQTWVVKTDSLGNKQWDKTLLTNNPLDDEVGYAVQTSDGCYAMANSTGAGIGGNKSQPSQGGFDYWIVKFCDTTLTGLNEITNFENQFWFYPNPVQSTLTFYLSVNANITIINLLGEKIFEKNLSSGKTEMDFSFLPSGIYFIKAGFEVRKFVKE